VKVVEERVPKTFQLPVELVDELTAVSRERCVGVNLLVTSAITEYLARLIPMEEILAARDRDR
jgi:hypothetical protein